MINSPSALGAKSNGSSTQFMQEVKLTLYLKNAQDLKMRIEGYSILRRARWCALMTEKRLTPQPKAWEKAGESQIP